MKDLHLYLLFLQNGLMSIVLIKQPESGSPKPAPNVRRQGRGGSGGRRRTGGGQG